MNKVDKFKDSLLYEIQKEFWNERGRGARYRLTRIGISFLEDIIKKENKKTEFIKKWLVKNDFCKKIEYVEKDISIDVNVEGCCLRNIRDNFISSGMEILACPLANIFMYLEELKTNFSPELLPIKNDESTCKITLAKALISKNIEEV